MKITAQVVSVDYAPQLALSLPIWKATIDRILVVTAERDEATRKLCEEHGVETLLTDVFWKDGAAFNKGAAIVEGFEHLQPTGWHLFFDADVVPPADWLDLLQKWNLRPDCLYGAHRYLEDGSLVREGELAGCFHLAHASHPAMKVRPIVDTCWSHAGVYDSTFQTRWPRDRRIKLPLRLTHIGVPFTNWMGVGNNAAMQKFWVERRRHGGHYEHERIQASPPG